jgi:[ribosomal protein S5]-alanine N-acetyltransferase
MARPPIKKITGVNIDLVPFSKFFISYDYLKWMKDKDVTRFIIKTDNNISLDDIHFFAEKMIYSNLDYFFAIIHKESKKHIGNIRLGPIDFNLMKSKFGILIGDKSFHGCGVATEVLELIKHFSFNYLKLEQIRFGVVKENKAAMRLYAKTHFTCLGETKETFNKYGKSWKIIDWSMNKIDYIKQNEKKV